MKTTEWEFSQPNNEDKKDMNKDGFIHHDPMIAKAVEDKFVPPVVSDDPLARPDEIPVGQGTEAMVDSGGPRMRKGKPHHGRQHHRRHHMLLRRGAPAGVVILLFLVWLFLRLAPVPFGTVLVDGNEKMTYSDVYRGSGIEDYVNVVQLSPSTMQDKLRHDLRVADVTVSRELPATIHVRLQERKVAAVIATMYGFAYIDNSGTVIALEPQIKGVSAPILTGKRMDTLLLGDVISDSTVQAALQYLTSLSAVGLHNVAEINVGSPQKIIAYTTDSIPVRLGSGDAPAERARLTEELLREVKSNQLAVEYIDTNLKSPLVKSK